MANSEHLEILLKGAKVWNGWRKKNPDVTPDLRIADMRGVNLHSLNLSGCNLFRCDLRGKSLLQSRLENADLFQANLRRTNFTRVDLRSSNLSDSEAQGANFSHSNLAGANLENMRVCETIFHDTNLTGAKGLENMRHLGPSLLDHKTVLKSNEIPLHFLQGCGLPDAMIEYLEGLKGPDRLFKSCFISHSTKDQEFADQLFRDLQASGVRCWYSPEEMKGGEKLYDQIDSAIKIHDKLLLVLSKSSMDSEWVRTEIRRCRKAEKREGKRKLFPIRLVDYETIQEWECFDADSGKDMAIEVREFFVPDFSNWKDPVSYESAFNRILRDLQDGQGVARLKKR